MNKTNDWHFAWCPSCNGAGRASSGVVGHGPIPNSQLKFDCGTCGGNGLIRVPNGYRLVADAIPVTFVSSYTNTTSLGEHPDQTAIRLASDALRTFDWTDGWQIGDVIDAINSAGVVLRLAPWKQQTPLTIDSSSQENR